MNKRFNLLGLPIDALTMRETIDLIDKAIQEKRSIHHVVLNAAKVVNAQNDPHLKESIIHCDVINADGQSLVWAGKLLKVPIPERVAGIDLMSNLVEFAATKKYKIFLLGAKEQVVQRVADIYEKKYGSQLIAGYKNGYFSKDEELAVAQQIADSGAKMLFVALTSPKKEVFLNKYKDTIQLPFVMGVGGSFDVIAGKTKRAPQWMQKAGMEWLYRVLQEPRRMWKRYLVGNSKFIYLVLKFKLQQGLRAFRR